MTALHWLLFLIGMTALHWLLFLIGMADHPQRTNPYVLND